jgi:hypothetical protein
MHQGFEFSNAGGILFDKRRMLQAAATAARQGSQTSINSGERFARQRGPVRFRRSAEAIEFGDPALHADHDLERLGREVISIHTLGSDHESRAGGIAKRHFDFEQAGVWIIALHRFDRRSNGGAISGQAWRDDGTDR